MLCLLYVFSPDAMHDVLDILCQYCVEFISPCVWSIVWSLFLHVFEVLCGVYFSYAFEVFSMEFNSTVECLWWHGEFFVCALFLFEVFVCSSVEEVFILSWSLIPFWRSFFLKEDFFFLLHTLVFSKYCFSQNFPKRESVGFWLCVGFILLKQEFLARCCTKYHRLVSITS